jgi:hypothetical protein
MLFILSRRKGNLLEGLKVSCVPDANKWLPLYSFKRLGIPHEIHLAFEPQELTIHIETI